MTKNFKIIVLLLLFGTTVYGQVEKDYTKTLKKMFEVSGTEESYQIAIEQMFTMFKKQYSDVEEEFWNELKKEFSNTSMNDITEMLVPVYSKYMTIEDMEEIIKFYQSDVGKKLAKNNPMIMQESMQIGQQWGMKIGQEFDKKMKIKGY